MVFCIVQQAFELDTNPGIGILGDTLSIARYSSTLKIRLLSPPPLDGVDEAMGRPRQRLDICRPGGWFSKHYAPG
jgi:hypothetical protein